MITQPPLPLRMLLMLLLTLTASLYHYYDYAKDDANNNNNERIFLNFGWMAARHRDYICNNIIASEMLRAWQVPFCGMLLFFLANENTTTESAVVLIEHGVYYALIHAVAISLFIMLSVPMRIIWTTVAYMALYYAWHMHLAAHFLPNVCIFSKFYLSASLLLFSLGVLPLLVSCGSSTGNIMAVEHLVAWTLSDACCFLQNTLHPLKKISML